MEFVDIDIDIDQDNAAQFDKEIDKRPTIVFVLADWCEHCKTLKPAVAQLRDKLKIQFKDSDRGFIILNENAISGIHSKHVRDISSFPSIFYVNEDKKHEYDKPTRDYDTLLKYCLDKYLPQQQGGLRRSMKKNKMRRRSMKKNKMRKKSMMRRK